MNKFGGINDLPSCDKRIYNLDRYMQSIVPDHELRIVHEYTEGYYNGYQNGKEQALEDIASFYG